MKKFIVLSILALMSVVPSFADDTYELPDYYNLGEKSGYFKTKNHFAFSLDGGSMLNGGYAGVTFRGEYSFNDYISLDYLNTNLFVYCDNSSVVSFGVRPIGVRLYTPTMGKRFRAYTNLDLGWGMLTADGHDSFQEFAIDFGVGIHVCKNVTLGYSLIKMTNFDPFHGAKIGFIF